MSPAFPLLFASAPLASLSVLAAPAWESRPLREIALQPQRSAQAQVVSLNTTRMTAEIAAPIQALLVEPGQVVRRGEVLARLDCRDHEIAARRAESQLEASSARARLAVLQLERAQRLLSENFISRDLLDTRQAEHDAARAAEAVDCAALETARRQVEKCVVRAPFPAIVSERLGQVGEMAEPDRELPAEVKTPEVYEITTSSGFPTAMVLIRGRAFDEGLRRESRRIKEEIERMAGVDRVFATGLSDPELRVSFRPEVLAARGLTAADLADSVARWFQDTPAGRARVEDSEWLLRVLGQQVDPDYLAGLTVFSPQRPGRFIPLEAVAAVERAREKPTSLVSQAGEPAVLLALNKKSYTNTLELVSRIRAYLDARNAELAGQGIELSLLDDQTIPTRQAIDVMQKNAAQGWVMVMLVAWLFLGSRMALLVGLGIPFSLAGTFWILHAGGWTFNMSVLLGAIIALGMLVDDAVVILEDIYYRMARGA